LSISGGVFNSGMIKGYYPRSEKVLLNDLEIVDSNLFSDSYNNGFWLEGCNLSNTTLRVGCCGAGFTIDSSTLNGGGINETNNYYDIIISNSSLINFDMNLNSSSSVSISNSIIVLGSEQDFVCNNLSMEGVSLNGQGSGVGLELKGNSNNITQSTISGFETGIELQSNSSLTISESNFSNNSVYNIYNGSISDVTATNNWWGSIDETTISRLIWDSEDDINLGSVNNTEVLIEANNIAPVIPPLGVIKFGQSGDIVLQWSANSEADISGYKIYYGSTDALSYDNVLDVGNVTTYTLDSSVLVTDEISVTAYDNTADGVSDQLEGFESWYSTAVEPEAEIELTSATLNLGVAAVNEVVSKELIITNIGTADLVVSNIISSNNVFTFNESSFTVTPQETYSLTINFTPTSLGQETGTLTLYHNSQENSNVINLSGVGVIEPGTMLCGVIESDLILTEENSPYYVLCDVQVPSGVILTIEPGVEIIYTDNYEILVKGELVANGLDTDYIVFRSDEQGIKKGKRFINFSATDLSRHELNYIHMQDGNIGIQVGDETEFSQGNKNTGTLLVSNIDFTNADIKTSGYDTEAVLSISGGVFNSGMIKGDYPRSEKVLLNDLEIVDSNLFSD